MFIYLYLSSLFFYFVNQIPPIGIPAIRPLSCIVCMAHNQNKVFYPFRFKQGTTRDHFPSESNGGDLLRLGGSLLWQPRPDGRYVELPLQQHPGI